MTFFSFFKYFDAFELDVNVVDFVYYGKTRLYPLFQCLPLSSLEGLFNKVQSKADFCICPCMASAHLGT